MNRRDFLKRLGGAAALVTLSPLLDLAPIEAVPSIAALPLTGTIGAITRSTYIFWRNQTPLGQPEGVPLRDLFATTCSYCGRAGILFTSCKGCGAGLG